MPSGCASAPGTGMVAGSARPIGSALGGAKSTMRSCSRPVVPASAAPNMGVGGLCEGANKVDAAGATGRSEEHTSELQSLMRISYAVFCLKTKRHDNTRQSSHDL